MSARLFPIWGVAVLVLSGLALANGTARDGRGASGVPSAFAGVGGGACSVASLLGARRVSPVSQSPSVRPAPRFSLRMSMGGEELEGREDRLLWSRRLNRAFLTLGTGPEDWGTFNEEYNEERLLWSRRLARAYKVLSTDPDLVPVKALWSEGRQGRLGSMLLSSAAMLEESAESDCTLEDETIKAAAAAVMQDCVPRPNLPTLKAEDLEALRRGDRVQRQTRNGRVGTGMVVVDVDADVATVFAVLTDIDKYPERIPTVRAAVTYHRAEKLLKTQFQISKFRLQINTELRCKRDTNMLEFRMDPDRPAPFLEDARGFWFIEAVEPGDSCSVRTRIWLVADLACSMLLPTAIVDYASARALPRATAWLKPVMKEMAGQLPAIPLKSELDLSEEAYESATVSTKSR